MSTPENSNLVRALEFAFEPDEAADARIGPYQLLEKIGEGGFGVVWMAEQQEPVRRRVALKIIKTGMDTRELIARFEAERQALALMDHPNIARVFDAGATESGRPYFVMELVRGTPITQFCDENRVPTEARLRLFIDVCQAVHHAHQKGIIHRDLKPSNILITLHDGKPVPKIIDFGIAKALGGTRLTDKTLFTRFHTFIGTPAYTSPEQIEMSGLDVDTRSDIYSLGVLLYELLTGETPFDAKSLASSSFEEIREKIRTVEPLRPSARVRAAGAGLSRDSSAGIDHRGMKPLLQAQPNPDGAGQFTRPTAAQLRGDLDWVVMRCLEKDRARRYESAAALAADVERHLAHEPVIARPPNAGYTLQKLIRRHRGAFAAACAIAAVLVIGAAVSTWQAIRATRAEHEQGRLRSAAEAQERTSRRRAYAGDMNVVQQALADGNLGRAQTLLNRQRPKPGETDLRDWEWRYLWQFCQGDSHSIVTKRPESFSSIAASSDGKWLAAGPTPIIIWKRQTGASEEIATPGFTVTHVAFSPREPILALAAHSNSAARFRQVILWSVDQRQIIRSWTISPNGNECTGLFFSEDGRTLATSMASAENEIGLWRVPTGEKLRTFPTGPTAGQPRYSFFAVTDDVKLAAYISREDYHVHVLDLATGEKLWSKGMGTEWVTALRFSPDGKILAVGERAPNCTIRLCDAVTGVELGRLEGHRRTITQLVFWPDGQTLASASWDHTARLWDVSGRRPVRTFRGHTGEVHSLALLPDNRTLVTGSKNGELLQWDTSSDGPGAPALTTIPGDTVIWRFSGDGSTIVTLGRNGRVAERRGENYREEKTLLQLDAKSESQIWPAESITIGLDANVDRHRGATLLAADGPRLAHISAAGNIEVWDWEQGERVSIIVADESAERLAPLGFTDKGEKLTLFRYVPRVRATREEWDVASGRRTRSWPTTGAQATPMKPVVFAPDQKYFISIVGTSVLVRTDLDSDSKAQVELDFRNFVPRGGFSPDGSLVAVPTWNGLVHIVNVDPLRSVAILSGFTAAIHSATFSPNGRRLATGSGESETMMLWDVGSYERVLTLQTERPQFRQAAFRADGNVLGALAGVVPRTALHLWRAPSWLEIETAESAK